MEQAARLGREDWLRAGRRALIRSGSDGVRIERLARDLKVTKGSFYWHFKDRDELLEVLLREWEEESEMLFRETAARRDAHDAVEFLREYLAKTVASPSGEYPPDVGIYLWAATCPRIAARVNRIERLRIDALAKLCGRADRAELAYLVWLGFIFRRHRAPRTAEDFPLVFDMMADLLLPAKGQGKKAVKEGKRR
jgi:AcrR family transcriptional regulator